MSSTKREIIDAAIKRLANPKPVPFPPAFTSGEIAPKIILSKELLRRRMAQMTNTTGEEDYGYRPANQALHSGAALQPGAFYAGALYLNPFPLRPDHSAIPNEGIRAGEVIGYRAWRWIGHGDRLRLRSLTVNHDWPTGKPAEAGDGDIAIGHGIFAFKSPGFFDTIGDWGSDMVFGSLEMWGEVIEHEFGYRAQYARVRSIDSIDGYKDDDDLNFIGRWLLKRRRRKLLTALREAYGVAE